MNINMKLLFIWISVVSLDASQLIQESIESYLLSYNTKIITNIDTNRNLLPDINIPLNWTKSLSSTIEYRALQTTESSPVKGNFDDSLKDETIDKKTLNLYLFTFRDIEDFYMYSVTAGYSIDKYEKKANWFC
ncbi:hypothetical protein JHD50_05155 [Sulfurimonas sp. MAG313]|nr:hypothetical protein [Sulfurimonas sp. MAG313]MDF1880696.1 hypothetical protein [Sulfurimonas sp. MAG313]